MNFVTIFSESRNNIVDRKNRKFGISIGIPFPIRIIFRIFGNRKIGIRKLKKVFQDRKKIRKFGTFGKSDSPRGEAALWDCVIKIHAANLTSLRFRTTPVHEYSFLDVSSLVYVVIDLSRHNKDVHRVVSLVKGLLNLRDLTVYASCIESLSAPAVVPHLQSLSRLMHLRVLQGYNLTVQKLIDFLCHVPNIESLSFPEGLEDMFTFKGQGRLLEETPQSFLSSLKCIEIAMFNWNQRQIWLLAIAALRIA
ncbi:hypothetical protein ACHQM5_021914 [Ranunculus cassubicifolius]